MPVAQQPLPALAAAVSDGVESPTAHDVSSVMDVDVVAPQPMSPVASDRDDAIQPETGLGTVATREGETQLVPGRKERVVRAHRKGEPVLRCPEDLEEWSSRFDMKATLAGLSDIIANPDLPFPLDAPVPPDPKNYFYSRQKQTDLDGMEEARNALREWQKDWMSYVAKRACYDHQVEAHTELRDWMLNTVKIDATLDDEDQRWYSPTDNVRELWTKLMAVMNDESEWAAPDEDSGPRTHWPRKWTGAYMRAWALRDAEECVYTTMGGWKSTSTGPSTVDHADPPQLEQAPPGDLASQPSLVPEPSPPLDPTSPALSKQSSPTARKDQTLTYSVLEAGFLKVMAKVKSRLEELAEARCQEEVDEVMFGSE
jgi:hypothetical protein